jgi:hypothetical protein
MKSKVEVRRVEERVQSCEAIQRLAMRVTFDSLAKAEQFRKLAIRMLSACNSIGRDGFVPAKTQRSIESFRDYVEALPSFYTALPARDMRKVRAFLKGKSK